MCTSAKQVRALAFCIWWLARSRPPCPVHAWLDRHGGVSAPNPNCGVDAPLTRAELVCGVWAVRAALQEQAAAAAPDPVVICVEDDEAAPLQRKKRKAQAEPEMVELISDDSDCEADKKPAQELSRKDKAKSHKPQRAAAAADQGWHLSAEGKETSRRIMMNDPTLTELSVNGNMIGYIGACVIAEALKVNEKLTELDVGHNRIGDAGAIALAEALKVNKTLMELDVNRNNIGAAGATAIAEALTVNKTLTTMYVSCNIIGDSGARALAEALKLNKTLTTLDVRGNSISKAKRGALRASARPGCHVHG